MIEVVPFKAEHVVWLKDHGGLSYLSAYVDKEKLRCLETGRWTATVISPEGGVLACAGALEFWDGRAELWALFNPRCRKQFLLVHRALKRILDSCPIRRLEASVDSNFPQGHRWVKMLGFQVEAPRMRAYNVIGGDAVLYSRIRGA